MVTGTYAVRGLKCGLCLAAVMDRLRSLAGVTRVQVDLVRGGQSPVVVTSDSAPSSESVREAVRDAGFELVTGRKGGRGDP